ncbi:hypothetical protein [Caulobacter sp. BP25]|uniref:hypothetical protein n=1 Tax=Caulobacter sp. BP25 TaxID=2048900 RepID=UPI000C12D393|nr:hypothetical protein [Caulobacter sp. BP25]PHY21244.1 hypothetical protein CSW59_05725 [Caulobacter sp. BP25]
MKTSILKRLIVVATALTAAPAISAPKNDGAEVCTLGARILAEQARAGVKIFDSEGASSAEFLQDAAGRSKPPPSQAEWKLLQRPTENLFTRCPQLMKRLPEGVRMATPEEMAAVEKLGQYNLISVGFIHAPLITPDGRTALVFESMRCPGLCGNGSLTAYHRAKGSWVKGRVFFRFMS